MSESTTDPPTETSESAANPPQSPTPPKEVTEKPEKPKKPEPDEPKTLFDIIGIKLRNLYNSPYGMKSIYCTILFLFALEVFRELKHIEIPMYLYKPFRRLSECFKCVVRLITN